MFTTLLHDLGTPVIVVVMVLNLQCFVIEVR